jgi:aminopeptidase N
LTIEKASVDGKATTTRQEGENLYVKVPGGGKYAQTLAVRVVYHGRPTAGVYFVADKRAYPSETGMVYTQGEMEDTRYWLPTYDYPDDKATSEGILTVPAEWNTLSNGTLVKVEDLDRAKVFRWKMDKPHSTYLISFVAGRYTEFKEFWNDLTVSYFVPPNLAAEGAASFAGTNDMVRFYSELTGVKYPWSKYSQATVADYMFGGMENVSATTQTITTLHRHADQPLNDSEGLVLHELAHQWFGDYVTTPNWSHIWINEGWASFLPHFYVRQKHGDDAYHLSRFDTYSGALGALGEKRPMVTDKYTDAMEMFDGYAYAGGAARMMMLLHELGESKFWVATKGYLEDYGLKSVDTPTFFRSYEKHTGADLATFEKNWFYTANEAGVTIKRDGSKVVLSTAQQFPMTTTIQFADETTPRPLTIQPGTTTLEFVGKETTPFLVDPEAWLLVQLDYQTSFTPTDWQSLWKLAPNAAAKARIMGQVLDSADSTTQAQIVSGEKFPQLKSRLIDRAGKLQTADLLKLAEDTSPFVQNAALRKLGTVAMVPESIVILQKVWQGSLSEPLRSTALNALLSLTKDEKLAQQAWETPAFNESYRETALNWWATNKPDEGRELALKAVANPPNEAIRRAALSVLARLKDKPGESRVYDVFVTVAQEETFGPRMDAIQALAGYGDKKALPILRSMVGKFSLHFMRNTLNDAIKQLEGK